MPNVEKKDIISEYETHFISGKQDGKCEEEIARKLGNPKTIAKELTVSYAISNADKKRSFKNMITALFSVMSLSVLNFAFIFIAFFVLLFLLPFLLALVIVTPFLIISPILLIGLGFLKGFIKLAIPMFIMCSSLLQWFTYIRHMLPNGKTSIRNFSKVFEMECGYFTKTLLNIKGDPYEKYILYALMLLTVLLLPACSNSSHPREEDDVQSIKDVTIKIPETIFTSSKKNETINEDEMKQNIKTYLDYSGELYENIVPLSSAMSDEKVTESDREKLKQLVDLAQQNDANFHHFISNNMIPSNYKQPSKEIHNYISASTALSVELDQEIEKFAQDGNLFKTDFSFTKRFEKVNGRKQKEIEKFLKEKILRLSISRNNKQKDAPILGRLLSLRLLLRAI